MLDTLTTRRLTRMVTPKAAARLRAFRRYLGKSPALFRFGDGPRVHGTIRRRSSATRLQVIKYRLSAMRSPIPCIMVLLFALAISAAAAEDVTRQDAENRIELPGFSILPPAGRDWRPYSAP
jgi:hypothetical protein